MAATDQSTDGRRIAAEVICGVLASHGGDLDRDEITGIRAFLDNLLDVRRLRDCMQAADLEQVSESDIRTFPDALPDDGADPDAADSGRQGRGPSAPTASTEFAEPPFGQPGNAALRPTGAAVAVADVGERPCLAARLGRVARLCRWRRGTDRAAGV